MPSAIYTTSVALTRPPLVGDGAAKHVEKAAHAHHPAASLAAAAAAANALRIGDHLHLWRGSPSQTLVAALHRSGNAEPDMPCARCGYRLWARPAWGSHVGKAKRQLQTL